jgi:hypothetical protein
MPRLSDDPTHRAGEEQCLADVEKYDVHVLHVHGGNDWPRFTYSVGLYRRFGLPEVIMLGLKHPLAHWMVNELAARAREGARFRVGDTLDGLLEGFSVALRPVPPEHVVAHFGWAIWFYDGEPFPAAQLVVPTTRGVWPWDAEASEEFLHEQPVLESTPVPAWARAERPG